jgi:cyanophycinase
MKKTLFVLLGLAIACLGSFAQPSPIASRPSDTRHGPEKGSLIIIGGGGSTPEIC